MLAHIAPDHPAHIAVTQVAMILHTTALAMVLLCVSVIVFFQEKALTD